jgi:molecular chaperone HtpG
MPEVKKEKLSFQTEVKQLLHMMIHSMYSNKEVFLRELISNSSDGIEKLRFFGIEKPALLEDDTDYKIYVLFNKDDKTITISDNGVGMSRDDIIKQLGTIAHSGTKETLSKLTGDKTKDSQLIGQFGVGFYSAFIVSDKVTVLSRKAGEPADSGVRWISSGDGEYEVENYLKESRGTDVILHVREDASEFLDDWRLRSVITKYSDHIPVPIAMQKIEVTEEEGKEGEEKKKKEELVEEIVNKATAIWMLNKSEIKDDDYKAHYTQVSHDPQEPLAWIHNRVEGNLDYTNLLYIPKHAPFDLWNRDSQKGLKLYVQRVFIMDEAEQFLPGYLRFVKGLVDTNNLPLNISREILQGNRDVVKIRSALTKRVLDCLDKMAKDDAENYTIFWKEFGQVLKEAPSEDFANRERVAKLFRFTSNQSEGKDQSVSLEDYVSRMQESQEKIYTITAESYEAAKNSPHLELFNKKGLEVLLLTDRVDEWLMMHLNEFDGKSFQSITKGDVDLGEMDDAPSKEEKEKVSKDFESVLKHAKEILGDKVKEVRMTYRLTDSPACVVSAEEDMGANMQRILKAAGQDVGETKPILELNPEHEMVQGLKTEADDERFTDWVELLFGQAILAEGGQLENPAAFVRKLNSLLATVS